MYLSFQPVKVVLSSYPISLFIPKTETLFVSFGSLFFGLLWLG